MLETPLEFHPDKLDQFVVDSDPREPQSSWVAAEIGKIATFKREYFLSTEAKIQAPT